jgi:hypothetical protein
MNWVQLFLCFLVGIILGTTGLTARNWQTWAIILIVSFAPILTEEFK